jgi:hypothetical protein
MRRCEFCEKPFLPDRRLGARQRGCGRKACKKARHAANCREWREANPVSATTAAAKAQEFRDTHPDYWRERRRERARCGRERRRRRERRREARELREGNRDSISIVQVIERQLLGASWNGVSDAVGEGNRDSIPSEVLVFLGLLSGETRGEDGNCDSMDRGVAFWEGRGRRLLERFASLRRA